MKILPILLLGTFFVVLTHTSQATGDTLVTECGVSSGTDNGAFLNSNVRGMLLSNSHNNDVVDNRFGKNRTGIYLLESHENSLFDNVSKGNVQAGIRLRDSRNNEVADSNASLNDIGIEEIGEDLNNIYEDNVCRNNTTIGSNVEGACN